MTTYHVPLSLTRPLSLNSRQHHLVKARQVAAVREEAARRVRALRLPQQDTIHVELHYRPRDNRRRDSDNLVATQKPAIDGIVDAGLIADDCAPYVTWSAPRIHAAIKGREPLLWLEIQTSDEEAA